MLPTRITLAGCSTISVTGRSRLASASVSTATPSGPTTTTRGCSSSGWLVWSGFVWSLIALVCRDRLPPLRAGAGLAPILCPAHCLFREPTHRLTIYRTPI